MRQAHTSRVAPPSTTAEPRRIALDFFVKPATFNCLEFP